MNSSHFLGDIFEHMLFPERIEIFKVTKNSYIVGSVNYSWVKVVKHNWNGFNEYKKLTPLELEML